MKQIILASSSARRKELLEMIGLKFKVVVSNLDEKIDPELKLKPHDLVKKLSLEKAKVVFENYKDSIIIAADTFVVCSGKILGKPKNKEDAKKMLKFISGKIHVIITGFTIIDGNNVITKSDETKVWMRKISNEEITAYIRTGEPFDKAGAYAIQGLGSIFIEKIEGNFDNAVGLPIYTLAQELKNLGVK